MENKDIQLLIIKYREGTASDDEKALLESWYLSRDVNAISELSSELSHQTYLTTYAPFTPSESEQRLGPLYYRGCWHRVSRPFLFRYNQLTTY